MGGNLSSLPIADAGAPRTLGGSDAGTNVADAFASMLAPTVPVPDDVGELEAMNEHLRQLNCTLTINTENLEYLTREQRRSLVDQLITLAPPPQDQDMGTGEVARLSA